jgi:DNA-binding PadR family transcriptional regulator
MTAGAASGAAGDLGAGLFDMFGCAEQLREQFRAHVREQVRRRVKVMAAERRHAEPGRGGHGRRSSGPAGHWGGGFVGAKGGWWPGPPTTPGPKASRGDVRAAILALLKDGPRNGYQIMSDIEERSNGAWRPSPGAIYPALSQLADEGLITGEESGGKRAYRLTDAGREYVAQNPERARGAWESSEQQEAWQIPGLFAEAARLGSGIVQLAHAGSPAQVRAAEKLLQQTRREIYRILAETDETEDDESAGSGSENEQES